MQLSKKAGNISPSITLSITAKANELKKQGVDVVSFGAGEPDFNTPENIINAAIKAMKDGKTKYTPASGILELKETICKKFKKDNNLDYKPCQITISTGAKQCLANAFMAILNPGDEVLTFSPFFGEYNNYVKNFDGVLVPVQSEEGTFQPNLRLLEESINEKTKALIINSPNNPTGVIYTEESIKGIAKVLEKKQKELGISIYLISDEPYRELVYDNKEVPYILKYYTNAFVGYSYSKSLSLPGERIGYIAVNPEMEDIDEVMDALNTANRILGFVNAPSLFQRVIGRTLGSEVDVNIYKKNRDLLYNHLISLGFECVNPDGAFYLFPKSLIEDDKKFVEMGKKYNLIMVPGSSFGKKGYVRLAYCINYKIIENSLDSFTKLAEECKKINNK